MVEQMMLNATRGRNGGMPNECSVAVCVVGSMFITMYVLHVYRILLRSASQLPNDKLNRTMFTWDY